jgi:hypothetical protein
VSGYFVRQSGRRVRQRHWPELTAVLDTATHRFLAARVTRGPGQDAPRLVPAVRQALRAGPLDTVLADAGYDSEDNHATPRRLGVRATVIALNWRGRRAWPRATYRRQMVRRFRKKPRGSRSTRVYGQRWQIESGFSRNKRRPGATVGAVRWAYQKTEILLKVPAHNIMLNAARPRAST